MQEEISMDNKALKLQRLLRTEGMSLSENAYNSAIGIVILWGLLINILVYRLLAPYVDILTYDFHLLILSLFVATMAFVAVVVDSHKPIYSFLGFTGLAATMGTSLTVLLSMYSETIIYRALLETGIVVVSMMIVSMKIPGVFLSLRKTLVLALIGSIVVELIGFFFLRLPLDFMDYIVVIIFAGYIGYDWAKAQVYPKTLDNAVDSAADIYVDVLNIFVRLLRILGKKND